MSINTAVIAKKAHMGDKRIVSETVPHTVTAIEEWAYANCSSLSCICIPVGCDVADNAFAGCGKLEKVCLYREDTSEALSGVMNISPVLLAMAIHAWPKDTGLLIDIAGDNERFINYMDTRLPVFLNTPDEDGFTPFLAGGEEDYEDADAALKIYAAERLKLKAAMIYERISLSDAADIPQDRYARYTDYLKRNNPHPVFEILNHNYINRDVYCELYFSLGLDHEADPEELILLSSDDTELRARVLSSAHSAGSLTDPSRLVL